MHSIVCLRLQLVSVWESMHSIVCLRLQLVSVWESMWYINTWINTLHCLFTITTGKCLGIYVVYKYFNKCMPLSVFVDASFFLFYLSSYLLRTQFDTFKGCFEFTFLFLIISFSHAGKKKVFLRTVNTGFYHGIYQG